MNQKLLEQGKIARRENSFVSKGHEYSLIVVSPQKIVQNLKDYIQSCRYSLNIRADQQRHYFILDGHHWQARFYLRKIQEQYYLYHLHFSGWRYSGGKLYAEDDMNQLQTFLEKMLVSMDPMCWVRDSLLETHVVGGTFSDPMDIEAAVNKTLPDAQTAAKYNLRAEYLADRLRQMGLSVAGGTGFTAAVVRDPFASSVVIASSAPESSGTPERPVATASEEPPAENADPVPAETPKAENAPAEVPAPETIPEETPAEKIVPAQVSPVEPVSEESAPAAAPASETVPEETPVEKTVPAEASPAEPVTEESAPAAAPVPETIPEETPAEPPKAENAPAEPPKKEETPAEKAPVKNPAVEFQCATLLSPGLPYNYAYPQFDDRYELIPDRWDGQIDASVTADIIELERKGPNDANYVTRFKISNKTNVYITDSRIAFICKDYNKGSTGHWTGGLVAVGLNQIHRAVERHRRQDQALAGQLRYQWISRVMYLPKRGFLSYPILSFIYQDKRRILWRLTLYLKGSQDSAAIANEIHRRLCIYGYNMTNQKDEELIRYYRTYADPSHQIPIAPNEKTFNNSAVPTYYFAPYGEEFAPGNSPENSK